MKFHLFITISSILICGSCNTSVETQGIQQFLEGYYQTMSDRDWTKYRSYFWDKATITTSWQKEGEINASVHITTIDDFIAQTPEGPDSQPVFEERMLDCEIEVRNNLAMVWARYKAKFGTPENLNEWEGMDLFSLMRHQGQWKIVSLTFEANP